MQPTPARSPDLELLHLGRRPRRRGRRSRGRAPSGRSSCPTRRAPGGCRSGRRRRTGSRSARRSGPVARRSMLNGASGARAEVAAYAAVFSVPPVERCVELETAVVMVLNPLLWVRGRNADQAPIVHPRPRSRFGSSFVERSGRNVSASARFARPSRTAGGIRARGRSRDRAAPAAAAAPRARARGSRGRASRSTSARASSRRARRRAPELRGRLGMARLPALEPGQRVLLLARARPISISGFVETRRPVGDGAVRRFDGCTRGGSSGLLHVVRRPGRVAQALGLLPRRQLEQRPRASRGCSSMRRVAVADRGEARGHRAQREVARAGTPQSSSQVSGRRHARVGLGAHRVGARHRAVLGVLVVVEEDAVALLLPPLAGGELRRAPLDLAGEGQRGAPHLRERPARVDAHVDVDRRASPTSSASRRGRGRRAASLHDPRHLDDLRPLDRPASGRGPRAARRDARGRRRARGAGAARGSPGWPSRPARRRRAARPPRRCGRRGSSSSTTSIQSGRVSGARFW